MSYKFSGLLHSDNSGQYIKFSWDRKHSAGLSCPGNKIDAINSKENLHPFPNSFLDCPDMQTMHHQLSQSVEHDNNKNSKKRKRKEKKKQKKIGIGCLFLV